MQKYNLPIFVILLSCLLVVLFPIAIFAQTTTPTTTPTPTTTSTASQDALKSKIAELESKVSDLKSQGKTLSDQIGAMDSQIKLTELRMQNTQAQIDETQEDIATTKKKISSLESSINSLVKVLMHRIVATYQEGSIEGMQILLTSNGVNDFLKRQNYLKLVQAHDKELIYDTQQAKNDYANQKQIFETKEAKLQDLKAQLQTYTKQLDNDKQNKKILLAETQGSEANYQKLLAQARAQLAGFAKFATTAGGASILPAQASPDGWYFNQRDERWGNNSIGVSGEPVWKYGCLLSSVAMVMKQRGESVTPADIAGNSSYFFQAMMRIPWAGRISATWNNNTAAIDSLLASGKPVIVGMNAGAYGTHFIVLKSGSGGNYIMNDPWYGPDLAFSSHYSTGQIFQYGYLN